MLAKRHIASLQHGLDEQPLGREHKPFEHVAPRNRCDGVHGVGKAAAGAPVLKWHAGMQRAFPGKLDQEAR